MEHVLGLILFFQGAPWDNAFERLMIDFSGTLPKAIGTVILAATGLSWRYSDNEAIVHRLLPLGFGVGLMAWAPSVYTWLFT